MRYAVIIWLAAVVLLIGLRWTASTINERARDRVAGRSVGGSDRGAVHEVHND